jgi:hypothetical protein
MEGKRPASMSVLSLGCSVADTSVPMLIPAWWCQCWSCLLVLEPRSRPPKQSTVERSHRHSHRGSSSRWTEGSESDSRNKVVVRSRSEQCGSRKLEGRARTLDGIDAADPPYPAANPRCYLRRQRPDDTCLLIFSGLSESGQGRKAGRQ